MVSRILLAIDNSASSWEASRFAANLAGALHAAVLVLHVYAPRSIDPARLPEHEAEYLAASSLVGDVARTVSASGARARSEVRLAERSGVARAILAAAEEDAAELLVIGSRGRSELAGALLGSVSHEVLTHAACPVVIVRGGEGVNSSAPRRMLVAVGSEPGRLPLIKLTKELAGALAAEVILVHVEDLADALDDPLAKPRQKPLLRALSSLRRAGVKAKAVELPNRRGIGGELARAADTYAADIVLIGLQALSRLEELTVGGSSQGLLHHTHRPVLVAKALPGHRRPVGKA